MQSVFLLIICQSSLQHYKFHDTRTVSSRGRTGIKMQMQRMDLRTRGGGRVSWDEVREWHGHIDTTKCKTHSQWEAAAQHREISSVLCVHLEGWDREGGRETQEGGDVGIYVYVQLIHFVIKQKNTPLYSNYTPINMLKKIKINKRLKK